MPPEIEWGDGDDVAFELLNAGQPFDGLRELVRVAVEMAPEDHKAALLIEDADD